MKMPVSSSHRATGLSRIFSICAVAQMSLYLRFSQIFVRLRARRLKKPHGLRCMKTKTAIISIENLTSEDVPALRQALETVAGVDHVDFSVERSVAVLEFDPGQSHIDDFLRAVLKAGFKVL